MAVIEHEFPHWDRWEFFKRLCKAVDERNYEDVRVLLGGLRECVYKEMKDEGENYLV